MKIPTKVRIYGIEKYGQIRAIEENTHTDYGWFGSVEELRKFCKQAGFEFEGVYEG